jgi:hypothetical protein
MPINPNSYFGPALTDTQSELTAKIGSMKSILTLPEFKKPNIPKAQQVSATDYLLKIFNALGIDPAVVFNSFLTQVFDETGEFLEEKVLFAIADSMGEKGVLLSPYENNPIATDVEKKSYKAQNKTYLKNLIPTTFLQNYKQKIAKDLAIMIFGPKDGPVAEALNPNAQERELLIGDAVCGIGMFGIFSESEPKDSDIEYNRIKKAQELTNGQIIYEISCQEVKITLPEDPTVFFVSGSPNSIQGIVPPTPYQSLVFINQYVNNQFQAINNESNANKGGKSFLQIMVELLINYISTLIQPYLPAVFTVISDAVSIETGQNISFSPSEYSYTSCQINNSANDSESEKKEKKEFMRSLLNALLKDLIKLLLIHGIKYFKKFVKNYFSKKASERQRRKAEKARLKYEQITGKVSDIQDKIQKYQAALNTLTNILGGDSV